MNRPNQIQSNEIHAVKQQYNELLRFYNIMKKELDDLKEMHANNTYNSEGDNVPTPKNPCLVLSGSILTETFPSVVIPRPPFIITSPPTPFVFPEPFTAAPP